MVFLSAHWHHLGASRRMDGLGHSWRVPDFTGMGRSMGIRNFKESSGATKVENLGLNSEEGLPGGLRSRCCWSFSHLKAPLGKDLPASSLMWLFGKPQVLTSYWPETVSCHMDLSIGLLTKEQLASLRVNEKARERQTQDGSLSFL